jgi:pre-mRNA-processing factor SLU7
VLLIVCDSNSTLEPTADQFTKRKTKVKVKMNNKKRTREEWKKEKELEELRKAGTVPALVDEHGRDINPHIPQYISSAPWYIEAEGPTLKHQRVQKVSLNREDYRKRGVKLAPATKYRDGACENCGAMGHGRKDCVERPRKVVAKYSGEKLAPDELVLPEAELNYDGKRDRWNGFDSGMYKEVVNEYEKVEEAKRLLKEEKLKEDILKNNEKEAEADRAVEPLPSGSALSGEPATGAESALKAVDEDEDDDEDADEKYADHVDMPGTKVDSKQRITVRNLRIREDVAKYLRNLDPNSAYYDPKTRSMRDNPYKNTQKEPEDLDYAGDNFVRCSGKTQTVYENQVFAWQAADKGIDVHMQAEPTKTEMLNRQFVQKKEEIKSTIKESILSKYCPQTSRVGNQDDDSSDDEISNNDSNWNRCDSP